MAAEELRSLPGVHVEETGHRTVSGIADGSLASLTRLRAVDDAFVEVARFGGMERARIALARLAETAAALPSPFPPNTPTKRYVSFLSAEPSADAVVRLGAVDAPGERVTVVGRHVVAVLSVPFHEAKLTNVRTERVLGVRSTARDLRVVAALAQRWGPR